MHFTLKQRVLFKHCDPAGIVFFPRYAEMVNDAVEALFEEALDWPFQEMQPEACVPTVAIAMQFTAPSRHCDRLELDLALQRIGCSSLTLQTVARCGSETRFTADQTIVCIVGAGRPQAWPTQVRSRMEKLQDARG